MGWASGVRVNTVDPGYMPPMLNATNADERSRKVAATPLRRSGKPIEVVYGVLSLASGEASFVTGTESEALSRNSPLLVHLLSSSQPQASADFG